MIVGAAANDYPLPNHCQRSLKSRLQQESEGTKSTIIEITTPERFQRVAALGP
jgi:hypothetical protein